ncbi:MAG: hypothetical protein J5985_07510 [Kiritimatiellae bacterium]|nr:hypothetical protein [Kiritimatiellia bacterium]
MSQFEQELEAINGKINRWQTFEVFLFCLAGILALFALLTALDVWLRPRGYGRFLLSGVWLTGVFVSLVLLVRRLGRRRSPAAVAAFLERKFPQLDNHLINCVLFEQETQKTPWLRAYLAGGVPGFNALPLAEIKNRKLRKRAGLALLAVALALSAPLFFLANNAWGIALQRVANPFAKISPPTFANILAVEPGNKTIVQGGGIDLVVRASGRSGQPVDVEIAPEDDRKSTIRIGAFAGTDKEEAFSYRLLKVASKVRYRFRVGDAYPTETYTVDSVPPLAPVRMSLTVTPPAYTGLPTRTLDALTNAVSIPVQSSVAVRLACNRPVKEAALVFKETRTGLTPVGETYVGSVTIQEGDVFTLEAKDGYGMEMRVPVRFTLLEDKSPDVKILSPADEKAALPPSAAPVLQFEASDEYGLGKVRIERVPKGAKPTVEGELLKEWTVDGAKQFAETWTGVMEDVNAQSALRIVATDRADPPQQTVSRLVHFQMTTFSNQVFAAAQFRAEAKQSLGELLAKQKSVRDTTARLRAVLPTFDEEPWTAAQTRQTEIRAYAEKLARAKDAALGSARVALGKAIAGPLPEAVSRLARMSSGDPEARTENAAKAVAAQEKVLQLLGFAEKSMEKSEISQTQAGLLAILDGLQKGQTANLRATMRAVAANVPKLPEALADTEDNLAQDAEAMVGYCNAQAKLDLGDPEFAEIMKRIAAKATEMNLHDTMVAIAETMSSDERAEFVKAVGQQTVVTNQLESLRAMLREQREGVVVAQEQEARATIREAASAIKKLKDVQAKIVDALRATGSQGDKSEKLDDDTLEEIVELKEQMAEAMLKVATDLQSMPDLDAVNELVTDTYQTYEEMKQEKGSASNAVTEIGLQKEDFILDALAATGEKADEMETFLFPKPDTRKANTESIDKEEMKSAIGQVTMPEELQDIIGDLMEQEEKLDKEADDSVTNQGAANPDLGWGIQEGEFVDYSAAGKSGNQTPDHKDQDGRSQTGRQGMSDGEFMGRTAHIAEGDKNIDKRRTKDSSQAGDVEEEGHTDAVATGGGKNAGYSQNRGMEGGEGAKRQDSKVPESNRSTTESQLTRNYEVTYAQAQKNGLPTFSLGKVVALSQLRELLKKQNASPKKIEELSKKIRQELRRTYTSLENGVSGIDMGASNAAESAEEAVSAMPDEAPAEFREMVSDYFKQIGEMK